MSVLVVKREHTRIFWGRGAGPGVVKLQGSSALNPSLEVCVVSGVLASVVVLIHRKRGGGGRLTA